MKLHDLSEFEIDEAGFKLRLKRGGDAPPAVHVAPGPHAPAPAQAGPPATTGEEAEPGVDYIRSPMVGTFYRAPSPESPPYIEEGATVKADTPVCIIEAMKVMNEIQAEVTGSVLAVLVENGESVEYGQPLFKIKTA